MGLHPVVSKTLIAFLGAGGLWALIYFYEYGGEAGRLEAIEAEGRLLSIKEEEISRLEIENGGTGVTLLRGEGRWSIVEPVETRADQDKVDSVLSAATRLRVDERLEDIPAAELDSFSLAAPGARLVLSAGEDEKAEIVFGDAVPVSGGHYAMRVGESAVLIVTGAVESLTSASLDSLRYKKIVGVDLWELNGFSLIGEGGSLRLVRDGDEWKLLEPVSFPADPAKIRELWSDLAWLETGTVAIDKPGPEDLGRMKLDAPALRLELETEGGAFHVAFGGTDGSGSVFVRRSDLDTVMTVSKEAFERLERARATADDLRDGRVVRTDRFRLSRVEVSGGDMPLILVRNEDAVWRLDGREDEEVAAERVGSFLDAIEDLRASSFLDEAPNDPAVEIEITLTEKSDEDEAAVKINTIRLLRDPGADREERRMLSTEAPSTVYMLPAMNVLTLIDRIAAIDEPGDDGGAGEAE